MDLRSYLDELTDADQLLTLQTQVLCDLELAALCRREFRKPAGGRAILFKQLAEPGFSIAANLFGSEKRLCRILRSESLEQFAVKLRQILPFTKSHCPPNQTLEIQQTDLRTVPQVDLLKVPAIRSWPGETGYYYTLALTVTAHPESGEVNVGLYRAQRLSSTEIALNFATGSGADRHLCVARELGKQLPIALVFGSDPAYLWAASAPLLDSCNEFELCADLFASENRFINCISQNLLVPADAEMVIEGQIDPVQFCTEGPFGNHTGQYVTRNDCPLMKVTSISQVSAPILPMTVVGPPPSENLFLGRASEVLLRELLMIDYPQILNLKMPLQTMFHGVSLLTVRPENAASNRELIDNLWKNGPLRRAKVLILLDEDIQLESFAVCWWRTVNMLTPDRIYQEGGKIAIDATGVDPQQLVGENQAVRDLIQQRHKDL